MTKDLVGIKEMSKEDIEQVLLTASSFKDVLKRDIKKVPGPAGKDCCQSFF